jgi:hypothetical protein
LVELVEYALVIGQPEPAVISGSVVMDRVIGQPELVEKAGAVVMALVIGQPEPVEIARVVVMTLMVVVMAGLAEYALVLPPLVLVVMMERLVEMAESVEYASELPPLVVVCGPGKVRSRAAIGCAPSSTISHLCHRMVLPMHFPRQFFPSTVGMSISLPSYLDFSNCSTCTHAYRGGIIFPSNKPPTG